MAMVTSRVLVACGVIVASSASTAAAPADCAPSGGCAALVRNEQVLLQMGTGAHGPEHRSTHKAEAGSCCQTVKETHPCYSHIVWAMELGYAARPEMYPGLTPESSFADFQMWMHDRGLHGCPRPCMQTPTSPGDSDDPTAAPDPKLPSNAWVTKPDAHIPPGGRVRLYVVGTSNVVWQTWPDQLHAMLVEMGYNTTPGDYTATSSSRPSGRAPICENAADYKHLVTPRIGKVGWASWGFAFESKEDCVPEDYNGELGKHGFRMIAGHKVSCVNSWACDTVGQTKHTLVRPSDVAKDARNADIVILSHWMNDSKQRWASFQCFRGDPVDLNNSTGSAPITLWALRRLVRAIHKANPKVVVLIMARYPEAVGARVNPDLVERVAALNEIVKTAMEQEPNTYFVDYHFPIGVDMFQIRNFGHPNCRGDRVMATKALEVLFDRGVLGKGLRLPAADAAERCVVLQKCGGAGAGAAGMACCRRAPTCILKKVGECAAYGPGAPGA